MAFKSEIHVAELASIRTGHTEGDIYYILDNGMLGDLPCKPGTFVKWHNNAWQIQPDEHYALASAVDGEIAQAIDNVLDDGSTSEAIVVAVPSSQSDDYIVGNYYEVQGKVAKLRAKTKGGNVTQLTFDTTSGLLEAINNSGELVMFTYTAASKPLLSDLQYARDNGLAVFLVCGEDVHAGSYWLEKGTVLSLVFDTGRPGYGTHSMEFMCTGAFKGGDCVTVRCVVNGNNTWEWHAYIHPKSSAIAPEYDSTATYAVGDAVMHNGLRYECNTAISTAEAWNAAHWTETSVEDEIGNVETLLAAL